ncbi:MAG: LTA synthase family protein [Bacteroidetes bacterium]|nr:LTA synthase family protein [Bacteroidota bacterium]
MRYYCYILRLFLFWLVFFAGNRLIFILYQFRYFDSIPFTGIAGTFYHALPLDTSATCYLISVSFILTVLQIFLRLKFLGLLNRMVAIILIITFSIIATAELGVYDSWKTKINYEAISHLEHPNEVIRTVPVTILALLSGLASAIALAGYFFYKKLVPVEYLQQRVNYLAGIVFTLITPGVLFIGIRGGVRPIPIGHGEAYFSKHQILNDAAVNPAWNLVHSYIQNKNINNKNPYLFYGLKEAESNVKNLFHAEKDTTIIFLKIKQPNIVIIILESWSADLVKPLGGFDSITPCFNYMAGRGILFTNVYAAGNLSHEGILSILSGYPAQPLTSVIKQPDKYPGIPCITPILSEAGYNCAFIYGGELNYGNIKSFLYYNKFDLIIEQDDFPFNTPGNRLTVHDEYLFSRSLDEIQQMKEPFFAMIFTGSSHAPYDVPMKQKFNIGNNWDEKGYVNAAHYTDSCLGAFFSAALSTGWYKNTLFLLISDHGHQSPKNNNYYSKEFRKIPALFFGEAIMEDLNGKKVDLIMSQTDFTTTLLSQMGYNHESFRWSKNIFNPYIQEFAYFSFVDGVGWIRPWGYFTYDNKSNVFNSIEITDSTKKDQMILEGKSFLETVFQEYLELNKYSDAE